MNIRRNPEPGRQAVLWLATAFVVTIGAAACAIIILAAAERPSWHLIIWGVLFAAVAVFLASLAVPGDKHAAKRWMRLWLAARDRGDPKTVLRIGRKKSANRDPLGTNAPPSLESVREASEQNVSWVPHGPQPTRPKRER